MRTAHAIAMCSFIACVYGCLYGVVAHDAAALGLFAFGALTSFYALSALGVEVINSFHVPTVAADGEAHHIQNTGAGI